MYIDPLLFFLLLGVCAWVLAGPAPRSPDYTAWKRERRRERQAAWAACKANRQALRRRLFGSHPLLYSALAWASPVLVLGLIAWLH